MKYYHSKLFRMIAGGFFLGFPLGYIIYTAILFDMPMQQCIRILISPSYYLIVLCAMIAGYGLLEMKRWAWHLFILAQILITYEDVVFVLNYSESHHKVIALFISLCVQLLIMIRVNHEIRVPYFFPKIRWWESNPIYRFSSPVELIRNQNDTLSGEILDISIVGCFIKIKEKLNENEKLKLRFTIFDHPLECEGLLVWLAQSAVTHPQGVGIKFIFLTRAQKRTLKNIHKKLRSNQGTTINRQRLAS